MSPQGSNAEHSSFGQGENSSKSKSFGVGKAMKKLLHGKKSPRGAFIPAPVNRGDGLSVPSTSDSSTSSRSSSPIGAQGMVARATSEVAYINNNNTDWAAEQIPGRRGSSPPRRSNRSTGLQMSPLAVDTTGHRESAGRGQYFFSFSTSNVYRLRQVANFHFCQY